MKLEKRVAVITGAAGGIGQATACTFREEGAHVVLVDRDAAALERLAGELGLPLEDRFVVDVADSDQVRTMIEDVVRRHGRLDIVVANAGIEGATSDIHEYPLEEFDRVMAVNVRSVWLTLRWALPEMRRAGRGSIIVTSSTAGVYGVYGDAAYAASKHAVVGIVRSAALQNASFGIRVNTVIPGAIETGMLSRIAQSRADANGRETVDEVQRKMLSAIPMGRKGTPEEVAKMMLFLASDDSSYSTGGSFVVDGGRLA